MPNPPPSGHADRRPGGPPKGRRPRHSTRIRRALAGCGRLLLRSEEEAALWREACRTLVGEGACPLAFVARLGGEGVEVLACAGMEAAALYEAGFAAEEPAGGVRPLAAVLRLEERSRGVLLLGSTQRDLWQGQVAPAEQAAVLFPLQIEGEAAAVLGIGAPETEGFEHAEEELLAGFADDLAHAAAGLRARRRHEETERRLARANRALRTLSAVGRSLLRAVDEDALLDEMCRVLVEEGGYPFAWIGYAEHDVAKRVRVMACAGLGGESLRRLPLTWADTGAGLGPSGTAIRREAPVIARDLRADPGWAALRDNFAGHDIPDYAGAVAFPLRVDGGVIGNLSIYAAEPGAFDDDEVRLLAGLAEDLACGIAHRRERVRRTEAEHTIARMAFHDAVTGLPNRIWLRDRLDHAIQAARRQRRPLALLVAKVDQFQEISDSLGYREGGNLLCEISARLGGLLGEGELLARGGEDEFVLLLPGGGASHAAEAAQRLISALREPVELSGVLVNGRLSIGIALSPGHGSDPDALLRRAAVAAGEARRSAAGYALYMGSLDQDCTRRLALMGDLRHAIVANELQLYCQPKVDIASGRVCGAEALVRWPHPELGMIATSEFVPLAEHAGLISPLTHWVLDAAFGQAYAWRETGIDQPLAVNLSAQDLRDPTLLERIEGLFATWGARPDWVQFELTESALMVDPAGALETLGRLKQLGVELYIDDFGTGYSSLSYLQKLPVDSIKIDQSFVGSMLDSADASIIVRSTIELGHNLDLRVVAEGVECERVWDDLARLGCDAAQGYYVSRPIPAEHFKDWQSGCRWHHPGEHGALR